MGEQRMRLEDLRIGDWVWWWPQGDPGTHFRGEYRGRDGDAAVIVLDNESSGRVVDPSQLTFDGYRLGERLRPEDAAVKGVRESGPEADWEYGLNVLQAGKRYDLFVGGQEEAERALAKVHPSREAYLIRRLVNRYEWVRVG